MTTTLWPSLLVAIGVLAFASVLAPEVASVATRRPERAGRAWLDRVGRLRLRRDVAAVVPASTAWTGAEIRGMRRLAIVAIVALALAAPGIGVPLAVPLGLVVWRGPSIVIGRLGRRRHRAAAREVPLFLDLLAVATTAGLGPQIAVRRAAEPLRGPLAEELARAMHDADLGSRWRDELAAAAARVGVPDLDRAVRLLARTERLGSSLADETLRLASDVREERRSRAVERARAAPVKMLFPLVFLILPAFLLLTVVPVLLTTVASIG